MLSEPTLLVPVALRPERIDTLPALIENEPAREGTYRFLTTGDPVAFAEMGRRFLQLPIRAVEHVTLAELGAAA